MSDLTSVGFFCEDIREEKNGMLSLVGIFQDNINVEGGGFIPKLCVYVRSYFNTEKPVKAFRIDLVFPDGEAFEIADVEPSKIEEAAAKTKSQENPLTIFVSRAILLGVQVTSGRHVLKMTVGEESFPIGSLNINVKQDAAPEAISST